MMDKAEVSESAPALIISCKVNALVSRQVPKGMPNTLMAIAR